MLVYHRRSTYCTNRRIPRRRGIAVTDIRFRGERIVYELALMDAQAIYGGAVRDQFMSLEQINRSNNLGLGGGLDAWRWLGCWEHDRFVCEKTAFFAFEGFLLNVAVDLLFPRRIFEASAFADLAGFPSSDFVPFAGQATSVAAKVFWQCLHDVPMEHLLRARCGLPRSCDVSFSSQLDGTRDVQKPRS